jgi:ElaB/YqjD/DUF883 family membrane-anchored ribosome-binding protein
MNATSGGIRSRRTISVRTTSDDPEAIERDIDVTRNEMRSTLDALQSRFSPGQLLDRALGFMRDNGGEFASNLGNSVKQNPLPVVLTSLGLLWMMTSRGRGPGTYSGGDVGRRAQGVAEGLSHDTLPSEGLSDDNVAGVGIGADGGGNGAGIRERVSGATSRLRGAAYGARERAHGIREGLSGKASAVSQRMHGAAESARWQTRRAGEGFNQLLEEQPLLVGALGVAIGAVLGAMLPASETEDRLFGDTRDRMMQRAQEMGSQQYAKARDVVTETTEQRPATPG